jgi:2-polyprenyl-3-methyl-5-hydroxy-6-metoxy-1,4-benzoquinol methylase
MSSSRKKNFIFHGTCPYCHGKAYHFLTAHDINRKTTAEAFNYGKCIKCGLVFLKNIPNEMTRYYAGGYQPIPESLNQLRKMARKERYKLESILQFQERGRLLELGPWIGLFCCVMKEAGFDVTAIEMNPECVEFLKNTLGIRAIQSNDPANAMAQINEPFDVITMWHSLEHFFEPWKVLAQAARLLKPGGVMLVAYPNIESYEFSKLESRWMHVDAPRHLYFFALDGLKILCQDLGLRCVAATTGDTLSRMLRHSSWQAWARSATPIPFLSRIEGAIFGRLISWVVAGKKPGAGLTAVFIKASDSG